MSQLYVPDGTWTLCTEGKKIPRIQVSSQSTVKIAGGKLAATKDDRFDGNFVCLKMVAAAAVVGALAAAAIVATGGAALGGIVAAGVAGVATGAGVGGLLNKIPSVCSLLCKPAVWTEIHPKVKFEKKEALLQNATLSCLLGGLVTIKMPNLDLSIDMALIAGEDSYTDESGELRKKTEKDPPKSDATEEQLQRIESYKRLGDDDVSALGLNPQLFHKKDDKGFYAALYKKGDKYVLAYRGTKEPIADGYEDAVQGLGISSEQYNKSVELAEAMKKVKDNSGNNIFNSENTTITGHSLGGGLAAIAGGATGYPTYTYNAAGVHSATLKRNKLHRESMTNVQAYNASDDPLNMAQDNREKVLSKLSWVGGLAYLTGGLPRAAGQRMEIETDVGIIKGHTAIHIANQLEKELAEMGGGNTTVLEKKV